MKVAVLGTGDVGCALGKGLVGKHEVVHGSRDPEGRLGIVPKGCRVLSQKEAAEWGEVIFLAIPYKVALETVKGLENELRGKILVDVTNCVDENWDLALGFSTSGAEELAKILPEAAVVKAFNTIFAQNMSTGKIGEEKLTLFVAGDSAEAKERVMELGRYLGFEPLDCGPLRSARYLEPLGIQLIKLGYNLKMGAGIGFRLVHS